jgi:hypothetical protein
MRHLTGKKTIWDTEWEIYLIELENWEEEFTCRVQPGIAVVFVHGHRNSVPLKILVTFLGNLIRLVPSVVLFFGLDAEYWHDVYHELLVEKMLVESEDHVDCSTIYERTRNVGEIMDQLSSVYLPSNEDDIDTHEVLFLMHKNSGVSIHLEKWLES